MNKPSTSIRYNIFLLLCLSVSYYTVSHRLSDILKANNLMSACGVIVTVIAMLSIVISLIALKIKNEKFDEVYDFIKTSDALEKTKALAKSYTLSALNLIDKLPKGKNRELIAEITRKLLERTL